MSFFLPQTDKLHELIVYIAAKTVDDDKFGDTHLNKVLFFSDAFALQRLGKSITTAPYRKHANGPTCRALLPARRELVEKGDVEVFPGVGGWKYTVARREPNLVDFDEAEIALVDRVIGLFQGKSAKTISDLAHDMSPGWNLVDLDEDIPLETQLISRTPVPPEVLDRARELAQQHGW